MKPPAGVTTNDTLARGLVRNETRASTDQMQRLFDPRARYAGRFGARVREIRKDNPAALSGWLATEDALWRVNDGMLATVIAADRLDKQRPRWERMRKTANSPKSVFDPDFVPGEQVAT